MGVDAVVWRELGTLAVGRRRRVVGGYAWEIGMVLIPYARCAWYAPRSKVHAVSDHSLQTHACSRTFKLYRS